MPNFGIRYAECGMDGWAWDAYFQTNRPSEIVLHATVTQGKECFTRGRVTKYAPIVDNKGGAVFVHDVGRSLEEKKWDKSFGAVRGVCRVKRKDLTQDLSYVFTESPCWLVST